MTMTKKLFFAILILHSVIFLMACSDSKPHSTITNEVFSSPATSEDISLPNTLETVLEDTLPEYDSDGFPANCGSFMNNTETVLIQAGDSFDYFQIAIMHEGEYDYSLFDVQVKIGNPEVIQLISYDRNTIMNCQPHGITVSALQTGKTHVTVSIIYTPTGATKDIEIPVTVTDPAETAE